MDKNIILSVTNVSRFFGSLAAINGLSLDVFEGEIFGVAGPNGSGKTTLINTITHVIPPSGGEIHFRGHPIHNKRSHQICHLGIARTFQNPEIFGSMSVMDNLIMGAAYGMIHEGKREKYDHLKRLLEFAGLTGKEDRLGQSLVIGDKKRLMIAIALATLPKLLVLDEPCAGLTSIESQELISLIKEINKQGITIILIEHNMKVLMNISDRVMIMNHGIMMCQGTPEHVCNDDQVCEIYLGKKYGKKETA